MALQITKEIPASQKTFTAAWCHRNYAVMSPTWRRIRSQCGDPLDKCHLCGHRFADGEMMGMAAFSDGNNVLCGPCTDELTGTTAKG